MIISERIFCVMKQKNITQLELSRRTGIATSNISDWKKKKTNPVSDKILIISEVLGVSPYELLSGAEHIEMRSRQNMTYVVDRTTELGTLIETYQKLDAAQQNRLMGYMQAMLER